LGNRLSEGTLERWRFVIEIPIAQWWDLGILLGATHSDCFFLEVPEGTYFAKCCIFSNGWKIYLGKLMEGKKDFCELSRPFLLPKTPHAFAFSIKKGPMHTIILY